MPTREQERAQRAYGRVLLQSHDEETRRSNEKEKKKEAEYQRFAKRFPALIQNCGLAQAIAFAQAKAPEKYLADLAHVVEAEMLTDNLAGDAREAPLPKYQKLTRDALAAATWLKRYAEAVLKGDDE